jgi:hypothetical protein
MLTPAISASRTSSPRVIRWKASSTGVRGPPFLYLWPLLDAMTTASRLGDQDLGTLAEQGRGAGHEPGGGPHELAARDGVGHLALPGTA